MSEKALKRLVVVLAAAIVLYILVGFLGRSRGGEGGDPAIETFLHGLGSDSLAAITLTAPGGEAYHLVGAGGAWTVNDMPADSTAIARLKRSALDAKVGVLISSSEANHARLGVSADSAWTIDVEPAGSAPSRLLVGRNGSRMSSVYVRMPDETGTWEVTGDLRGAVARTLTDWRDKTIAHLDTTKVASMDVGRDGGRYTIERQDSTWSIAGSTGARQPAEGSAVSGMLSELARLDATGFATDTTATDSTQRRSLVVRSSAGDTLLAIEAAGTSAGWHVVAKGNSTIFDVPTWIMDRLIPKREDVVGKSAG